MSRRAKAPKAQADRVDVALRWAAAFMALAATVWLLILIYDQESEAWDDAKDTLRDDGFFILAGYFALLLTGAVAQTLPALRRRAEVLRGWQVVLACVLYGLLIAGFSALIASHVPEQDPGHRGDPGALYPTFLVCVLTGPVILALSGALFACPEKPQPSKPRTPDRARGAEHKGKALRVAQGLHQQSDGVWPLIWATAAISWLLGTVILVLLGLAGFVNLFR
jgi:hypothetical protein